MILDWTLLIARASIVLAAAGCCVLVLMRWRPLGNPKWHRLAWGVVLAQGLMLFPLSLQITLPSRLAKHWAAAETALSTAAASMQGQASPPGAPALGFKSAPGAPGSQPPLELAPELGVSATPREQIPAFDTRPAFEVPVEAAAAPSALADSAVPFNEAVPSPAASATALPQAATSPGSPLPDRSSLAGTDRSAKSPSLAVRPAEAKQIPPMVQSSGPLSAIASQVSLKAVLIGIWALGTLVVLGTLASNYWQLVYRLKECQPARRRWAEELQTLCLELGLTHQVRLDVHTSMGPFLCWTPSGPRVIVPVRLWNRLSPAERLAVLHHELCHLRRGDLWKACLARVVVALHWFNPLAWLSARKFDESAEWACDAQMAQESPRRITQLANALLTASQVERRSPILALPVTGGPLFTRVRRLVTGEERGDTIMQKCLWTGLLIALAVAGGVKLQWGLPQLSAQESEESSAPTEDGDDAEDAIEAAEDQADDADEAEDADTEDADEASDDDDEGDETEDEDDADDEDEDDADDEVESDGNGAEQVAAAPGAPAPDGASSPLADYAERIVSGDNESLKKFGELIKTSTGQVVMADRAAMATQEVINNMDPATQWQQFTDKYFERSADLWQAKGESSQMLAQYAADVRTGQADIEQIAAVFQEVAPLVADTSDFSPVLKRFLAHEAAAAFVYHHDLKSRLHPGLSELEGQFQEHLVRNQAGQYLIRPARRKLVERRLDFMGKLSGPLGRLEKELSAWADDLVQGEELHDAFAATLRKPEFAKFVLLNNMSEDSTLNDDELDGVFSMLEDATDDTAQGLKLNQESDSFKELQSSIQRFETVWQSRELLTGPLTQLAERISEQDELHTRLKEYMTTDLALIFVAENMEYSPVEASDAAREWLAQMVTKNEAGKYEITVESIDDFKYRIEEMFREFRETRRRGRLVDEFASEVADPEIKSAMGTQIGKLELQRLVEESVERPDVDGLAVWFEQHFQETPDGLVLYDWAGGVIDEIVAEAQEIEQELTKQDF